MVNSSEVGCGQRVVWVAAHAARAVFGLAVFLGVDFSDWQRCVAAFFILKNKGE
jgi:hypothetical protein